ncbi:YdcH family protein [Methylobacterium sp. JK268]
MSLQTHLSELERKHEALEREIQEAISHPSTDDLRLVELKRRKLHLKDEINRLRTSSTRVVH